MGDIEKRLAALEGKIQAMEARRRRIVPEGFDSDPALEQLQKTAIQSALSKWQLTLAENGDPAPARFCELKETLLREMTKATEDAKLREAAEIVAAIAYYERTGQSPEGYNIIDTACRKIF